MQNIREAEIRSTTHMYNMYVITLKIRTQIGVAKDNENVFSDILTGLVRFLEARYYGFARGVPFVLNDARLIFDV
jgi:hypothetical protein